MQLLYFLRSYMFLVPSMSVSQGLKQDLLDKFSIDLVNNLIDERIQQEQAPYLKQKDFAKWIGESVATVNELRAKGLPVSYALGSVRYGKQSYIDFMKSRENLG